MECPSRTTLLSFMSHPATGREEGTAVQCGDVPGRPGSRVSFLCKTRTTGRATHSAMGRERMAQLYGVALFFAVLALVFIFSIPPGLQGGVGYVVMYGSEYHKCTRKSESEWNGEWMSEWVNEWVKEWMSGWMNGWMREWASERVIVSGCVSEQAWVWVWVNQGVG